MEEHTVVVLGASNKPERYSNMAIKMLKSHHYRIIPVHPLLKEIESIPVVTNLHLIAEKVHTLTLYVGPLRSRELARDIIALKPGRIIFNPGSESEELERLLIQNHISFIKGCTLIMLQTGQF